MYPTLDFFGINDPATSPTGQPEAQRRRREVTPSPSSSHSRSTPDTVPEDRRGTLKTRHDNWKRGSPWVLPRLTRSTVIIGDSNLSRISDITSFNDLEIHCFPGMKLHTAQSAVSSYHHGPETREPAAEPKNIIVSVGINDRDNAEATIQMGLSKLIKACKSKFPNSTLYLPLVSYSDNLSPRQIQSLKVLNSHFRGSGKQTLPQLPRDDFATDVHDDIHWTTDCANKTLHHWMVCLN